MPARFFRSVRELLKRYPPVANCLTYGTLFCSAELSQQLILRKYTPASQGKETLPLDTTKLQRYAVLGYTIIPNIMTVWYRWLDTRYTATTTSVIVKKVVLDQTFLTIPILVVFFLFMSWREGKEDITAEFREKFAKTFGTSCLFWLPAQTLNFKFVPSSLRIAYNGACGFIWANILCMLKRQGEIPKQDTFNEEEIKNAFRSYDKDATGFITTDQLGQVMSNLGEQLTEEVVEEIMHKADTDGDGQVNYDEFVNMLNSGDGKEQNNNSTPATTFKQEQLLQAFKMLDKDGDGFISTEELHLVNLTEEDLKWIMQKTAEGGDNGQVNYEEFVAMISSPEERARRRRRIRVMTR